MIGFGVCVGSWDKLCRNVAPAAARRPLIAMSGQSDIAPAYNTILDAYAARDDIDAVVLLHDDLEITDPALETKVAAALALPDVALVGVAGASNVTSLAWWDHDTVGHQRTDSGLIDFGQRTGYVDALEGSLLVLSRWAVQTLRFDEQYRGFHGYDEIVRQAQRLGRRAYVADIDTHHHTTVGWKSAAVHDSWREADERYRGKWAGTDLRVNLGCGDRYANGWHNVDFDTPHQVDERVDLRGELPWPPGTVSHVYAGHVFEHLTGDECEALLRRLRPCMTAGGELMVVGPDVEVGRWMDVAGADMHGVTLDQLVHGAGRWAGDVHRWEWSAKAMAGLLEAAGWTRVTPLHVNEVPGFWPVADRRPQWQRAVSARP